MKRLEEMDFSGKRVLVRVDFNVPIDDKGNITDDTRIKLTVPTLRYILDKGCRQIIVCTHLGRPEEFDEKFTTSKIADRLSLCLGMPVVKVDDYGEEGLPDSKIVVLENLRFNFAEKSDDEILKEEFARGLAENADVYVNDAFGVCHRDDASLMVSKFLPSCVGKLVFNEISMIKGTLDNFVSPFISVVGGFKADKINSILNLLNKCDRVLVGGALATLFLKVKGVNVGSSKYDTKFDSDEIGRLLNNKKLILPVDFILDDGKIVDAGDVFSSAIMDVGPKTNDLFREYLETAKTVIWNGPLGVFENEMFSVGTDKLVKCLCEIDGKVIVGGGDSASAFNKFRTGDVTHVSSGGGASLVLIEGKELKGLSFHP